METPVVFQSQRQAVVGMLHVPDRRKGRVPGVVLLHGFTGTKVESHRMFVKMARVLCGAGMVVLRFDFRGSGDSAGEFSTMTIGGELQDARAAMRFMRARPEVDPRRVGVLGLSMGGMVAALLLGEDRRIPVGVLWAAVADPRKQVARKMTPEARKQLKQLGCADYGGHAVGRGFFDDIVKHEPLKAIQRTAAAVLVVHGDQDETVPVRASADYEKALKKAGRAVIRHVVPGASHTFAALSWETEVLGLTMEWFRCNLL